MSEIDSGGNAFPYCVWVGDHHNGHNTGMTLRQWFAGMALQGMLSDPSPSSRGCAEAVASNLATGRDISTFTKIITKAAYHYADAMIRAGKVEK
jgi:hypothetical protein